MAQIVAPERLTPLTEAQVSTAALKGVTAISPEGDELGTVDDVVMADGSIDAVIVEVGGLIGIGTKRVVVKTDTLDLLVDPYDKYYVRLPIDEPALEGGADDGSSTLQTTASSSHKRD